MGLMLWIKEVDTADHACILNHINEGDSDMIRFALYIIIPAAMGYFMFTAALSALGL
jgi:hypothetical protein